MEEYQKHLDSVLGQLVQVTHKFGYVIGFLRGEYVVVNGENVTEYHVAIERGYSAFFVKDIINVWTREDDNMTVIDIE